MPFFLVNWRQGLIMLMAFLKFIACPICMQGLITSLCLAVLHADLINSTSNLGCILVAGACFMLAFFVVNKNCLLP